VTIIDGKLYSHHSSDPLANGHKNDAFDVFCILMHDGDQRAATRAAAKALGLDVKSRPPAPPPLGELPRAPSVDEPTSLPAPECGAEQIEDLPQDASNSDAASSASSSGEGGAGGDALDIDGAMRRFALVEGTTNVWDFDKVKPMKRTGFEALVGKPLAKEWMERTDKKLIASEKVQELDQARRLSAKKGAALKMDPIERYVYIDGTKDVWDREKKRRIAEGAVKMALGEEYKWWLGAMLQVQMKTAGGSDEAANNLKNWMEKIGSGDVVKAYQDAGIDYQASLNTGIQNGMSTLESSFALAMKYIQATDPAKAAKMAEAQAKISKETDPEKAKAMLNALEQSLRTGDIFADMQVKAALTAYAANRGLYEQLKQDSKNASGILDKNLAERRESSAQMWAETGQAVNDAMRSIGDAIRPATDLVAKGIKTVAQGFTSLSDGSQSVVLGITAVGAALMALLTAANAFKVARGVVNIGRGALLGRGGPDALAGNAGQTGIKTLGGLLGASNDADGGRGGAPQRVFVVNADAMGGASVGGSQSGGRRSARRRQQGRGASGNRQRPSGSRPAASRPAMPRPVVAPVPSPGMFGKALGTMGKVSKFAKGVPGASILDASIMGIDTFVNAKTRNEKAEGYGGAAGGLAGSLAGAAAGAAIGSVVPVIGTAIGGVVGAFIGGMGGQGLGSMLGKSWFGEEEKPEQIADSGKEAAPEKAPTTLQASPVGVATVVPAIPAPKVVRPAAVSAAELDAMSPEEIERRHAQLPAIARRDLFEGVGGFEGTGGGLGKGFSPTLSLDTVHKPAERAQAPTQLSQADLGMAMRALEGASQQSGVAAPMVAKVIERSKPEVLKGVQGESSDKSSGMGDVVRSLVAAVPPPAVALPVAAKATEQGKPEPPKVDQQFTFSPSLAVTVNGDVKDPARLASELMPHIQQKLEEFSRQVPRIDQFNESDFNFITRLARQYDCTAKVGDGKLLVMPRQGGQSASGKALGTVTITRQDVSRYQFRLGDKTAHKAVQTKHQDKKSGTLQVVDLNNDESPDGLPPVHTDRHIYPNKSAAQQAAKARLAAFNRSTAGVRLEMVGRTDLFAERMISAQGFKPGLDGEYLVDSVEQVFTPSGWTTTVECNGGKKGKATAKGKKKKQAKPLEVVQL